MPKAIQFDKFQEPPPEHGQELHARWRGLRLAAFCIGMASYGQDCKDLKTLENAVADAEVMYKKINEMPGCRAVLLKNPRRKDVMYDHLRHEFLELLVDDLPQVVLVYAAGHGTQMGQDVCLIPVSAKLPDHRGWDDDDCRMNCVSHMEIFRWCKNVVDEKAQRQYKKVHYLQIFDICRDGSIDCGFEPYTTQTPVHWSLCFSTSRGSTALDGSPGSGGPFVAALNHAVDGIFASDVSLKQGISNACQKVSLSGQTPVWTPNSLPNNFSLSGESRTEADESFASGDVELGAAPLQHLAKINASDTPLKLSPSGKRRREDDDEFVALLQKHGLDDVEQHLKDKDLKDMNDVEFMASRSPAKQSNLIQEFGLSGLKRERLSALLEDFTRQKKQKTYDGARNSAQGGSAKSKIKDDNASSRPRSALTQSVGRVSSVISDMKSHVMDAGIQEDACREVWNLTFDDDNKILIAEAGGIPLILAGLKNHAKDANVVKGACWALFNLASNNGDNKILIREAGGIPLILAGLENHAEDANVVKGACWALYNLASNNGDNKILIAAAGGIPLLLAGLKNHAKDADVVKRACWVLFNLASNNDSNKILIEQAGGIYWLLQALENHAKDAGVVEGACRALANLSDNDDDDQIAIVNNKVLIAAADGIPLILAGLNNHAKHAGVGEAVCAALCNIGSSDKALQKTIKDAGAEKSVGTAVRWSGATENTKIWGQKLLDLLCQL